MDNRPYKILFVCTGNICRSPTADAVMRHKVKLAGLSYAIEIDSAGTHDYHIGHAPDERSRQTALRLGGIDMSFLRARQVAPSDFKEFDLLVAMDRGHYKVLKILSQNTAIRCGSIIRFMELLDMPDADVPDPYYGGQDGFDKVYEMIERGCDQLITRIRTILVNIA